MSKIHNSSVDMVILTDRVMGKTVQVVQAWGKKTGNQLHVDHKKDVLARVAALQKKYVGNITGKNKVVQFCHDEKDEDAVFEVANFLSHKSAEMQGFSEPSKPLVKGESFIVEELRSSTPLSVELVLKAIARFGEMMEKGQDPVELSRTNALFMPGERSISLDDEE